MLRCRCCYCCQLLYTLLFLFLITVAFSSVKAFSPPILLLQQQKQHWQQHCRIRSVPRDHNNNNVFDTVHGLFNHHHQRAFHKSHSKSKSAILQSRNVISATTTTTLLFSGLSATSDDPETPSDYKQQSPSLSSSSSRLDDILADCTNAFPLWVLSAAIMGAIRPSWLLWVNYGSLIPFLLATVMLGTGMTLQLSDFTSIVQDANTRTIVPVGVLLQYTIMPLAAYTVASWFFPIPPQLPLSTNAAAAALSSSSGSMNHNAALFLGLLLVGCAPGGTASNLVSLIAKANVGLSVLLTACSTVLATFVTPWWVQLLFARANHVVAAVADGSSSTAATAMAAAAAATVPGRIQISGSALMGATARVVLVPVLLGMWWNMAFPNKSRAISRFTPFLSVLLVSLICGGVVANNRVTLQLASTTATSFLSLPFLLRIWSAVVMLHTLGFGLGYLLPKLLGRYSERDCRTLSIEVGMQNSALAVVLAKSCLGGGGSGGDAAAATATIVALAALPGALSATTHSCLGSLLAAYWRLTTKWSNGNNHNHNNSKDDYDDDAGDTMGQALDFVL